MTGHDTSRPSPALQVKAEEGGRGREKTEAGKRDESYSRRKTERQELSLLSGTED
jgi:hypothetical protein